MATRLAIVMTGQIRTFFENNSFEQLIITSKKHYSYIYVVCVVNASGSSEITKLDEYMNRRVDGHIIIDYSTKFSELESEIQKKISDPVFLACKANYLAKTPNYAHISIGEPGAYDTPESYGRKSTWIIQYAFKLGFESLRNHISETGIVFDIVMRTRFDGCYPAGFYPHMPTGKYVLSFNEENHSQIERSMNQLGIHDLIKFNKETRLVLPNVHTPIYHYAVTFGGRICYNYESLENIIHNAEIDNILYSFGSIYEFSNQSTMLKLEKMFEQSCLIFPKNPDLLLHTFCQETQLVTFCLENKINILMYSHEMTNMINR